MVNTGLIVIAFVCAGVAGWNVARKQYFKKKWKDLNGNYGKLKQDLTNALGEVGRVTVKNNFLTEENKSLDERVNEYNHLMASGCRNLKVTTYVIPDIPELPKYSIAVVGQSTMNPDLEFIVKAWTADNEEDREFAIRQAEELIEIIQNF